MYIEGKGAKNFEMGMGKLEHLSLLIKVLKYIKHIWILSTC